MLKGSQSKKNSLTTDFTTIPHWHQIYYALAALTLISGATSLFITHRLTGQYSEVLKINRFWTEGLSQSSRLSSAARSANAPGNDIFDSHDVPLERGRLNLAITHYKNELNTLHVYINHAVDGPSKQELVNQVNKIDETMNTMLEEANLIFNLFERRHPDAAGSRMAIMDRKYAQVLSALSDFDQKINAIQDETLVQKQVAATQIRVVEKYFTLFIAIMVFGITLYGQRLSRFMQKAVAAISNEKSRFISLIEGLNQSAIVALTDVKGTITFVNDKFCEITGYDRAELIGSNHRLLNSGFHHKEFFDEMWKTISKGEVWHGEICNRKKDGSLYWVESSIMSTQGSDGQGQYMAIRFDITERKNSEAKLRQSSKMASLGEMASGVAHEINNPLAIILGKAEKMVRMMENPLANRETVLRELTKVKDTANRIAIIVKGLRTFSRSAENDPFLESNLKTVLTETLSLCQERFKHQSIDFQLGEIPEIQFDARSTQISQVLLNLLNNAYDAVQALPEKWIRVEAEILGDNHFQISVTDSGIGIPKDIADRLMEPFFTTKEVGQGTGLGLSISRGIAQDHGGSLSLDTHSAHTRFVLKLLQKQGSRSLKNAA